MFGLKQIKNNKNYDLNNIYVAYMGIKKSTEISRIETIICRYKHDSYGHHAYTDILTGNKYHLWEDYHAEKGENAIFHPKTLLSVLKNGEYKNNIMNNGYVTREQIIEIYNALNNETGIIETKPQKQLPPSKEQPDSCTILNNKNYNNMSSPIRENELEKLMISLALNKKITLIVGNSGTGKTFLIDQLTYLIQQNKVPDFLKNKIILEVNLPSLQRKDTKKDTLENRINSIIDFAKEKQAILFIDETDDIVTPTNENENQNTLDMLKYAANRENLKIITTTSSTKYQDHKINPSFKQSFDIIEMTEPAKDLLTDIITQNLADQSTLNNISLEEIKDQLEEITTILIVSTNQTNINQTKQEQNPGLVLSIIDKSFAIAKVKNEKFLTIDHISKAINDNNQLNNNSKQKALTILETLKEQPAKEQPKQLKKK